MADSLSSLHVAQLINPAEIPSCLHPCIRSALSKSLGPNAWHLLSTQCSIAFTLNTTMHNGVGITLDIPKACLFVCWAIVCCSSVFSAVKQAAGFGYHADAQAFLLKKELIDF